MLMKVLMKHEVGLSPAARRIKLAECLVVFALMAAGVLLCLGALPPVEPHAEGTRGLILLLGMPWCAWLLWKRRHSTRNTLVWIMFVNCLSYAVDEGPKWNADGIHPLLAVFWFTLTIVLFVLGIFDVLTHCRNRQIQITRMELEDRL